MKVVDSKNIDTIKVGDIFIMKCPETDIVHVMKFKRCTCGCGNYMIGTRPHQNKDMRNESMLVYQNIDGSSGIPVTAKDKLIQIIKNNKFFMRKYTTSDSYLSW